MLVKTSETWTHHSWFYKSIELLIKCRKAYQMTQQNWWYNNAEQAASSNKATEIKKYLSFAKHLLTLKFIHCLLVDKMHNRTQCRWNCHCEEGIQWIMKQKKNIKKHNYYQLNASNYYHIYLVAWVWMPD